MPSNFFEDIYLQMDVPLYITFTDKNTTWFEEADDTTDISLIADFEDGLVIADSSYSYPVLIHDVSRSDINYDSQKAKGLILRCTVWRGDVEIRQRNPQFSVFGQRRIFCRQFVKLHADSPRKSIRLLTPSILVSGNEPDLTPCEFKLLQVLMSQPGRVFSRDELIARVQGYDYEGYDRTIDSHIKNLRKKLVEFLQDQAIITTVCVK